MSVQIIVPVRQLLSPVSDGVTSPYNPGSAFAGVNGGDLGVDVQTSFDDKFARILEASTSGALATQFQDSGLDTLPGDAVAIVRSVTISVWYRVQAPIVAHDEALAAAWVQGS
jgi:hypothetical protein